MKILKRIISSALVFTIMASFTVFGTKAEVIKTTDFITSDTDIDAILKTPYVDAVPTAFSELILGIHSNGFGFAKDTLLRTGTSTNYDMQVGVKVNGDKITAPEGYYYPSHTSLSGSAQKEAGKIENIAPDATVGATYSFNTNLPSFVNDGIISYANTPVNRWATWKSPNNSDTLTFDLDGYFEIGDIDVHFFTDGSGTQFPTAVKICYYDGEKYVEVPNVTYPAIVKEGATKYTFDKVTTNKITIELTRVSGKGMGVTEVEIFGKEVSVIENVAAGSAVSATYSYSTNLPSFVNDGIISYANSPVNRWATWKSPNNSDTLTFVFDKTYDISNLDVHFFTDGSGTQFPTAVKICYYDGEKYVEVPNVTYPAIVKEGATKYTFDKVTTNRMTIELTRVSGKGMGVTEVEIFGKESSAAPEYTNVAIAADVSSSVTPKYNSVSEINDGNIGYYAADNNRWNTYTGTGVTKVSTVDFKFESQTTVDKIIVYPYDERAPYGERDAMLVPENITLQYVKDGKWTDIPSVSAPESIVPGTPATYTFPAIKTEYIRATVTAYDGKTTGITELEIYGTPSVQNKGPYSVEVSEDKFITTDNVVTSVVTVKNVGDTDADVKFTTQNSRAVTHETRDGYNVVMSACGAMEIVGGFEKSVTLAPGESTEYISTLSFAKSEAEAKANATAVVEDKNRLENHKSAYLEWFKQNVPFFVCDDEQITKTYYFRWLTYRNNIRLLSTDKYMISEFMPNVGWAGAYNSIVAPLSHHMNEGRWIKNGKYIDDYKDFWFETEGARVTGYVNSTADAYYSDYLVTGDKDALIKHLDNLIAVYSKWESQGTADNAYYDDSVGLYFVKNGYDGMEYSLSYKKGGEDVGYRPTVNAYMYGDAMAISQIATLAGKTDLAKTYYDKAQKIKTAVEDVMWNAEDNMFEAYDLSEGDTIGIKEIIGYVPWYYNMPTDSEEFAKAWQYLTDENTFYAPYGPTSADKSHPDFNTYYTNTSLGRSGSCNWDGSSWPFASAQTLTAAANAINNYQNAGLDADDFYTTLKAYTNGQFKNGYSWVGENLDGDTGKWYIDHAHRSYHYNHSAYADLIITGLVGIRPADNDDTVVINPLVPENTLSSFVLENVEYRGNNLTVVYDKTGDTCGVGKGLTIYVNGEVAKTADTISKQTVVLATHEHDIVTVEAKAPTYTSVGWNEYEYCTVCDYTTYKEIEMLETPYVLYNGVTVMLAGDGARRVYWGYIGSENTEYKWFNDFKAQCGDTFTSEFNPKADDRYLFDKNGYYRFVVNYIDDNGKSVDRVFTFKSEGQDVAVPAVTVDGNYAVITTDGAEVNKLYYGYIGTENTAYTGFDRSVLTEADFNVKDGDSYLLNKAGYYRFVVNYKQGDRLVDKVYTVKVETDGGVPDVTYADGKIKLSTNGVKVNKLYLAYNGEESVEVTSWADYCEKAIARVCYQTPADGVEYTLANSGSYTVLVNYFDGNKNVDKYFTINN